MKELILHRFLAWKSILDNILLFGLNRTWLTAVKTQPEPKQ